MGIQKFKVGLLFILLNIALLAFPTIARADSVNYAIPKVSFVFDDGLESTYALAGPTLAKYGYSGTVGVITGCVGMTTVPNTCEADEDYAYMTWDKISQLSNSYGWEVASHTVNHPMLATATPALSTAQVLYELSQSQVDLKAHGFEATSFITPYGDYEPNGHPVLASIAKYYQSMRGFQDTGFNTFPYSDYLLRDQIVHATTSISTIKSYIDTAKANNQWLILTFHHIVETNPSDDEDDFEYTNADLDQVAAYIKNLGVSVVNINDGLVTSDSNLLPNSSFDTPISSDNTNTTVWSTDNPVNIRQDTSNNGNVPDPKNSVYISASSTDNHLFSPYVTVDPSKKYLFKSFLDVTSYSSGRVSFYIDEYDVNGVWLAGKNYAGVVSRFVQNINFEYTPSLVNVAKARLQIVVYADSGIQAYLDNCQWFTQDGTTSPPITSKIGDVNNDSLINALDLSIMLTNWGKAGATTSMGDVSGDTTVGALDLSILLTNWGK